MLQSLSCDVNGRASSGTALAKRRPLLANFDRVQSCSGYGHVHPPHMTEAAQMHTWHAGGDLGSQSFGLQGALQQDAAGLLQQLLPGLQPDQISVPEPKPQIPQSWKQDTTASRTAEQHCTETGTDFAISKFLKGGPQKQAACTPYLEQHACGCASTSGEAPGC